jgi:hypothetical protein
VLQHALCDCGNELASVTSVPGYEAVIVVGKTLVQGHNPLLFKGLGLGVGVSIALARSLQGP